MKIAVRRISRAVCAVMVLSAIIAFQSNTAHARVGGGSSYKSADAERKSPRAVTPDGPEKAVDGAPARERDTRDRERERSDWLRDQPRPTQADFDSFRWFGIAATVFLLVVGIGITALGIFKMDRSSGYLKGVLAPVGAINAAVWLLAWAAMRNFSIPFGFLYASMAVTAVALVVDGLRSAHRGAGGADGVAASPLVVEKTNAGENGRFDLQREDPGFSLILLTDFIHALYHELKGRIGTDSYEELRPFIGPGVKDGNEHYRKNAITVNEIVVGSIAVREIRPEEREWRIDVEIRANFTEEQAGARTRSAVIETWTLARARGTQSPEPERMQTICCPNCGAPAHFSVSGACAHCGVAVKNGLMQWYIRDKRTDRTEKLDAGAAVTYAAERGTGLPTVMSPLLQQSIETLCKTDSLEGWEPFWHYFSETIVRQSFFALAGAWTEKNWASARHLLTDRMYRVNNGWIELYRRTSFTNRLDDLHLERIIPVKIATDRYYQAITVRIFASCFDYVVNADGKVVGGSKRARRSFSEYWTFVRRVDSKKAAAEYRDITTCPACGASADRMGDTAQCGYCGSKISSASFSWVLGLITQDEEYEG